MLTLAVNVAVMTAAIYAVLAYMTWTEPALAQSGRDAPGIDPALLKALFLIFVELMLITAIALFFSTFSTPLLSAALTFGLLHCRALQRGPRNFERVVDSRAAQRLARGLYHVLPDLSAFDVKTEAVHGLAVPAGYLAITAAYGLAHIAMLLLLATLIFSRRDFGGASASRGGRDYLPGGCGRPADGPRPHLHDARASRRTDPLRAFRGGGQADDARL